MYDVMTLNAGEISSFEQYPFLSEFSDVFPEDLHSLPPK